MVCVHPRQSIEPTVARAVGGAQGGSGAEARSVLTYTDGFHGLGLTECFNGQYSDNASVLTRLSPWKGLTAECPDGHGRSMTAVCDGRDFGKYDIGIRILCGCEWSLCTCYIRRLTFHVDGGTPFAPCQS
jgi:hypothetical protein